MEPADIVAKAKELIRQKTPFVLATADKAGAPRMRWMGGLLLVDPLTVYMAAGSHSRKIDQIRANPNAQLMFHTPDFAKVVTLFGTCDLEDTAERRKQVWEAIPQLKNYAAGPDDRALTILRFRTTRVELLGMQEYGPEPLVAVL